MQTKASARNLSNAPPWFGSPNPPSANPLPSDAQITRPIARPRFGHPECLPHAHLWRSRLPFVVFIWVQHIFLPVAVEEVDDIAVGDRKTELLQAARQRHQRTADREARGNRDRQLA